MAMTAEEAIATYVIDETLKIEFEKWKKWQSRMDILKFGTEEQKKTAALQMAIERAREDVGR